MSAVWHSGAPIDVKAHLLHIVSVVTCQQACGGPYAQLWPDRSCTVLQVPGFMLQPGGEWRRLSE